MDEEEDTGKRKVRDPQLGLVVIEDNDVGRVYCGAKVGQFGKVCYERCEANRKACGVKSHESMSNKVEVSVKSVFVMGGKPNVGNRQFFYSTPVLRVRDINPEVFKVLMTVKITYDEWGYVFQALDENRMDYDEFVRLSKQLVNIKTAPTPSI